MADTTDTTDTTAPPPEGVAPNSLRGYANLQHAVEVTVPAMLKQARLLHAETAKVLSRG